MKKIMIIILSFFMLSLIAPSCKTNSYGHKTNYPYKKKKQKKNCKCPQFGYAKSNTYIVELLQDE